MELTKPDSAAHDQYIDLASPTLFINRELSWLEFNSRVLHEARNTRHPLLERLKFLVIYASNLNEFYMIRVSGLRRQLERGVLETPPDGLSPAEQLAEIQAKVTAEMEVYTAIWHQEIRPALHKEGIFVYTYADLDEKQKEELREFFKEMVFPILTPMAFDPTRPFPHISNLSVNLAIVVRDSYGRERFARLKIPGKLPGLIQLKANSSILEYVWLEEIVTHNIEILFPGHSIVAAKTFRVTRDADIELDDDEVSDLRTLMQEQVELRQFGGVVRLEVDHSTPQTIFRTLTKNLNVHDDQVFRVHHPLAMYSLMDLVSVDRPQLKHNPIIPRRRTNTSVNRSILDDIGKQDILLYHPYDSFQSVESFLWTAADDPDVLAIKQTLYRVGKNPDIIKALIHARSLGKQVTVLVELRARFDEANNIGWAQELERAGVHVIYGLVGLKVHAKMTLVLRKRGNTIASYVHLGTGNYNPETARLYTDFSFFTSDQAITADVRQLFNALTGYADQQRYQKLLVAPDLLRQQVIALIDQETQFQRERGNGHIILKLNSLVDKDCIMALYRASQAGVRVQLQVRGICCLRPAIPGVSDNISVTSIVGRFLEHTRIFYFANNGDPLVYLGSADLMPRNLERRVETLFPIEQEGLRRSLADILHVHLADNTQLWTLNPDGTYTRMHTEYSEVVDSQQQMVESDPLRSP